VSLRTKRDPNILLSRSAPYVDRIIENRHCGFQRNRSTAVRYFAFGIYWRQNGVQCTARHVFIDSKKPCSLVRKEELYNILIAFGITMKLIRLINTCLKEFYNRGRTGNPCVMHFLFKVI
jgi:hypothetical protein